MLSNLRAVNGVDDDVYQSAVADAMDQVVKEIEVAEVEEEEERAAILESGIVDLNMQTGMELNEEEKKSVKRNSDGTAFIDRGDLVLYQLKGRMGDLVSRNFNVKTATKAEVADIIPAEILNVMPEPLSLEQAALYFLSNNEFDKIKLLAETFNIEFEKDLFTELTDQIADISVDDNDNSKSVARWAKGEQGGYSSPAWVVPANIADATVLLRRGGSVVQWASYYSHAGLYSRKWFDINADQNANQQKVDCIQSATKPTTLLHNIEDFSTFQAFVGLVPKEYTPQSAALACDDAERIYQCSTGGVKYEIPLWEVTIPVTWRFFFSTSHDLTSKNTYCTKVPYTAWYRRGVDIDSRSDLNGCLISPDEIRFSTNDRHLFTWDNVRIRYWWKGWKTKVIQVGFRWIKTYDSTTRCAFEVIR